MGEGTKEERFWHRTGGNGAAVLRQGRGKFLPVVGRNFGRGAADFGQAQLDHQG